MNKMVVVARAVLAAWNRKCVETCGDDPGSVEFTYPNDYTEGMEFSCQITVDPNRRASAKIYKMEHRIGEFSNALDAALTQEEQLANLMTALEAFNSFCSRCDEDLALVRKLMCRGSVNPTNFSSRVFFA